MVALIASRQDHWNEHARQWAHIGPPLRPTCEDITGIKDRLRALVGTPQGDATALLLGVTPELAHLALDALQLRLIAVDRSLPMIRNIWATPSSHSLIVQGDWRQLPVASSSVVVIVGDGCFTTLEFPEGYRQVLSAISHALKPDGILSMRFFVSPDLAEEPAKVFTDLHEGAIGSFHIFKWRLAMALLERGTWSIPVHRIWQVWRDTISTSEDLERRLGWLESEVRTIDVYRDAHAIYSFPPLTVLREILSEHFTVVASFTPAYELGDRCPTIILRKKE